jgi:ACR3 family arsenite transporter
MKVRYCNGFQYPGLVYANQPAAAVRTQRDMVMMKVDFAAVRDVGKGPRGLLMTLFVNWIVKPFSMAFLAWLFLRFVLFAWIPPADTGQYISRAIISASTPCTAMVVV